MTAPPPSPAELQAELAALHAFNVEAFTLLGVALAVTALRTWARVHQVGFRDLWADDYLVVVAVVSLNTRRDVRRDLLVSHKNSRYFIR